MCTEDAETRHRYDMIMVLMYVHCVCVCQLFNAAYYLQLRYWNTVTAQTVAAAVLAAVPASHMHY
jgi:hypothetical protein